MIITDRNHPLLPKITIVTVCYNALDYLPQCIESVLQQRNSGFTIEHIIIDGNSTDGTPEYLQRLLQQKIISNYISEPDQGIYDAMNKGITRATGKVIAFLNADDAFLPGALTALAMPILNNHADYTMGIACVLKNERFDHSRWPDIDNAYMGAICCHQALFCKTSIIRDLHGFNGDEFPVIADSDLMAQLVCNNYRPYLVDGNHVLFRDGGVSSNCIISAADQYARLMEKYWTHLHQKCLNNDDLLIRVRWELAEKIKNLEKWSESTKCIEPLKSVLSRMQHTISDNIHSRFNTSEGELLSKMHQQLRFQYIYARIRSKLFFWGKKRNQYLQEKYQIKQKLKWYNIR